MELKKGTIKRKITVIEIRDFEVGNIITDSLLEKGYELIIEPIVNQMKMNEGESITVYRVEQR